MGIEFTADDASAWGLMGYVGGITKKIQTPAYINAVLNYSHSRLAMFFDEYFDKIAEAKPEEYQHVYEWPGAWHEYHETVGMPDARLWKHTLSGTGKNVVASFQFLPSRVPTPVNPILLQEGPGGSVKEGVHIFVWKAQAFEYAMPITVEPTLAKFLAYVRDDQAEGTGGDEGLHHVNEQEDGSKVNLSKGPVHFRAGDGKMEMKFTTQYILWFQTLAGDAFDTEIAPVLNEDLINEVQFDKAIKLGRTQNKTVNITAQASRNHAVFEEAQAAGIAQLDAVQKSYIRRAAAARRLNLYGE